MQDGDFFSDYHCFEGAPNKKNEFIYLDTDKRILKYKANLNHMAITEAMESCICNISIYDFRISDKKHAEMSSVPLKFLPKLGKFKLDENMFKTQNYLVPRSTDLMLLLNRIGKNCINGVCTLTRYDLNKLYEIMIESYNNKNYIEVDIILDLCSKLNIELVAEYDLNKESISKAKQIVESLTFNCETFQTLSELSIIMNSLNTNLDQICKLGLEKKFIEATRIKKQAQKVK